MTRTLITDPDCPHSVRDQINGCVTQEARDIASYCADPSTLEIYLKGCLSREDEHGMINVPADYIVGSLRALTTNQAEREQLEARVKELEIALRSISRETETDGIGDCWATRGARIARAALGITP